MKVHNGLTHSCEQNELQFKYKTCQLVLSEDGNCCLLLKLEQIKYQDWSLCLFSDVIFLVMIFKEH